jgi:hypothetical protein
VFIGAVCVYAAVFRPANRCSSIARQLDDEDHIDGRNKMSENTGIRRIDNRACGTTIWRISPTSRQWWMLGLTASIVRGGVRLYYPPSVADKWLFQGYRRLDGDRNSRWRGGGSARQIEAGLAGDTGSHPGGQRIDRYVTCSGRYCLATLRCLSPERYRHARYEGLFAPI